ncbi:hypothetical protein NERG_00973 [Nematocida ausubeli]|uniref:Uncharacterized protein n=1 Tax=Nematocida ausubeli (strain ATCC PRA-371 / ERTm2) TaxID=1913371 RepID=H8ZBM4_NEMA1|nr:hypothetical protein NERG_00973 [Nematocida ausubeli]
MRVLSVICLLLSLKLVYSFGLPSPKNALGAVTDAASKTPQGELASAAVGMAADATKDKEDPAKDKAAEDAKSANPNPKDKKAAIDSSKEDASK